MSSKDTTVYMIGNAHIDPVWQWRWREGLAEVLGSCRSALDRMREYPEFVFTRADAATYEWIEHACPEMFEEIRQRVAEGRWEIVGGWWEQPDCNIPCGESFVRHCLYGKRYFLDKFGVDVRIGYNVDSFGHSAGLPQILTRSGIDRYVFMRPEPREKDLPDSLFLWQGPDGACVLAFRLHGPYCTNHWEIPVHAANSIERRPSGTNVAACFYGVGNHGGGPTIANIEAIKAMQADPDQPNAVLGTLARFFDHAARERPDSPVVQGDLQHHAIGCYSVHSGIKALNRKAENALISAERFGVIAGLAGRAGSEIPGNQGVASGIGYPGRSSTRYPGRSLDGAWKKVLFNQFHDILAGTSIEAAYDDARDSVGAAIEAADYETYTALSRVACRIDAAGEGNPFVVFNPHPHTVKCAVEVDEEGAGLRDETGRSVPVQFVSRLFEPSDRRPRRVFVDDLPPLGYRLYYSGDWDASFGAAGTLEAGADTLRNDTYRITFDQATGDITQIADDRRLVSVLSSPAGAVVLEDPSDTWSHGVVSYKNVAGRFGDAKIEVVEDGPVRRTVRIESRFNDSTMWQDISLYRELFTIEFRITVDWREKHRMLKYEFPLNLAAPAVTADTAYSVASYPADGAENPCQKWIDVSGRNADYTYGVALANDGKYGFDVDGSTMRLSILRSPIYAFHEPREVEPGKRYSYMDQGLHSFRFTLLPHQGDWRHSGIIREAVLLNQPPIPVEAPTPSSPRAGEGRGEGGLPGKRSFGSISEPNIELGALKPAEDGDGLIVRLFETTGTATKATLELAGERYEVELGPFELKTLKIAEGKIVELDLIERRL